MSAKSPREPFRLSACVASAPQAQAAYRHVLERYPNAPKLVRLYGKFLETIKNDPWGAVSCAWAGREWACSRRLLARAVGAFGAR